MRSYTIPALIGLATILGAQQAAAPNPRDVVLAGDRFKPLKYDQMTPAQKTMIENLLAGERRGTGGPFNVLLRSPRSATWLRDWVQVCAFIRRCHRS